MAQMKSWHCVVLLLAFITTKSTHGLLFAQLLNSCFPGGESCGFLGLFVVMHSNSSGECIESCVFLPNPKLECGGCPILDNEEPSSPGYDIFLDFVEVPAIDAVVFEAAREKWQSVIQSDLRNILFSSLYPTLDGCSVPAIIDDLYICAAYSTIDGPGKIAGFAGPTGIRLSNFLTFAGTMQFDIEDVDDYRSRNILGKIILHEIGHIVGIGSLWESLDVTGPAPDCPYLGPLATAEFQSLSGCLVAPPTQVDVCGHWDEECMGAELMTGFFFLNQTVQPLSRITIASLADLGYEVDYSAADPFSKSDLNPDCQCRRRSQEVVHFGLPSSSPRRRQLSASAYQMAWNYGMNLLLDRTKKVQGIVPDETSDILYVGHKLVYVLVVENNSIFGVRVTNP